MNKNEQRFFICKLNIMLKVDKNKKPVFVDTQITEVIQNGISDNMLNEVGIRTCKALKDV